MPAPRTRAAVAATLPALSLSARGGDTAGTDDTTVPALLVVGAGAGNDLLEPYLVAGSTDTSVPSDQ